MVVRGRGYSSATSAFPDRWAGRLWGVGLIAQTASLAIWYGYVESQARLDLLRVVFALLYLMSVPTLLPLALLGFYFAPKEWRYFRSLCVGSALVGAAAIYEFITPLSGFVWN